MAECFPKVAARKALSYTSNVLRSQYICPVKHLTIKRDAGNTVEVADYFAFTPRITGGNLTALLFAQGVIAAPGRFLMYPAIALNKDNDGAIVFSLSSVNDYPSAAFVRIKGTSRSETISHAKVTSQMTALPVTRRLAISWAGGAITLPLPSIMSIRPFGWRLNMSRTLTAARRQTGPPT